MSNYIEQGKIFFEKKDYTKAIEYLQAAIEENSQSELAYFLLGKAYIRVNKTELAKKTLFTLLSINPNHKEALADIRSFLNLETEQTNVSIKTKIKPASTSSASGNVQSPQPPNANTTILQTPVSHPSVLNDPIVNILPSSQNNTPYWMIEQQSGNRIYLRIIRDYCIVVPPEKDGWNGFIKPHGTLFIPDSIKIDGLDYVVKRISGYAFSRCESITAIIIPDTIEKIGSLSFSGNQIKEIFLPDSIIDIAYGAFSSCKSLTCVKLPNAITSIKYNTFKDTRITFIDIPEKVKKIEELAFNGWDTKVERIRVHGMPFTIEESAFGYYNSFDRITVEVPQDYLSAYQNARFWQTMNLIPY